VHCPRFIPITLKGCLVRASFAPRFARRSLGAHSDCGGQKPANFFNVGGHSPAYFFAAGFFCGKPVENL